MSRVQLKNIPALKFQEGKYTSARRSAPIPQLSCVGKACDSYRPEVVRCENLGGSGSNLSGEEVDVDWKCEADLPEALRFGRVEVNCEGWSRPGDPYVMKESCGLEYRLVEIPGSYRRDPNEYGSSRTHRKSSSVAETTDPAAYVFYLIFIGVVCYMLYSACIGPRGGRRPAQDGRGWGGSGGPGGGGGTDDFGSAPPPPYSKRPESPSAPQNQSWRPGFATGAAAGAAATHLYNNYARNRDNRAPTAAPAAFDRWSSLSEDRGEGSSSMGATRRATGMGGSSVR